MNKTTMSEQNNLKEVPCVCLKEGRWRYQFIYFDVENYMADKLFIEHNVRLKITSEYSLIRDPHGYRIILCKVWKKQLGDFLEAIDKLSNKMLLCGHTDYLDFCAKWTDTILRHFNNGEDDEEENSNPAAAEV